MKRANRVPLGPHRPSHLVNILNHGLGVEKSVHKRKRYEVKYIQSLYSNWQFNLKDVFNLALIRGNIQNIKSQGIYNKSIYIKLRG